MNFPRLNGLILIILGCTLCSSGLQSQIVFSYPPAAASQPAVATSFQIPNQHLSTRMVSVNYLSDQEVSNLVCGMYPNVHCVVNGVRKMAYLSGDPLDLRQAEVLIRNMDKPKTNLEFSTALIEVTEQELHEMGIDWSSADGANIVDSDMTSALLTKILAMEKQGKARILANPTLLSLVDEDANIRIGDRVPYAVPCDFTYGKLNYQVQYLDAGIAMTIRGKVISDNIIQTKITSTVSSVKEWKATQTGDYPVLSSREINLDCQIKSGETMILGGLSQVVSRENHSKVPFLGDLPLVGGLFQSQTKENENTEVVFILTPRICRN